MTCKSELRQIPGCAWLTLRSAVCANPVLLSAFSAATGQESVEPPKEIGLAERAISSIALVQVMVDGPDEVITALTASDFRLMVDGKLVDLVAADNQCLLRPAGDPDDGQPQERSAAPTSYLFYFDQHNLTIGGREHSLDTARDLITGLIKAGNRAAIVSTGKRLVTFAEFTDDVDVLVAALERLREDNEQYDEYASLESQRQEEVQHSAWSSQAAACLRARTYQREETSRTESSLELFSSVLYRFLNEDPPKVAIYFGDTLRTKAGQHYLTIVSECELSSFDALGAFESVVQDAAAFGVRIYAVEAAGLVNTGAWDRKLAGRKAAQDAKSGLKALTLDTGGDAFLGGASTRNMLTKIREDSDCEYLLSFDPTSFPSDQPLSVDVSVDRDKVKVRSRRQLLLLGESARNTATLLAAFTSPDSVKDRLPIYGAVLPLGFKDGRHHALLQSILPASTLPGGEEWDVGMSLIFGRAVRSVASGRIAVDRPGVPIVLEMEVAFRPGFYEVRMVGQETSSGMVAAGSVTGEWPHMEEGPVITEIALLQPASGAFLRGDEPRTSGTLAVPVDRAVSPERSTAMMTLVCRGERRQKSLIVERSLAGASVVGFDPVELALEDERCAQFRDMIPADTLTPGIFTYTVKVRDSDAVEAREFVVSAPEPVVTD